MLKIKFLRNILLLSLGIALLLPLYDILVIFPSYQQLLTEETEDEAVRFARYLSRTLGFERTGVEKGQIPAAINEEVETLQGDALLMKLRVFDPAGEIVYSTVPEEIGQINNNAYFRDIVARGQTYSKVVEKVGLSAENQQVSEDVAETYVPILASDGSFGGAIEVYYDITASRARITELTQSSSTLLLAISTGLLIPLVLTLFHAMNWSWRSPSAPGSWWRPIKN